MENDSFRLRVGYLCKGNHVESESSPKVYPIYDVLISKEAYVNVTDLCDITEPNLNQVLR